jgi:hypothetical protein
MHKILVLVSQKTCDTSIMKPIRLMKLKKHKYPSIHSENQLKTLWAKYRKHVIRN